MALELTGPCLVPVFAVGTGDVIITVSESSHVDGDEIFLRDIAQIEATPFLKEILEAVSLGRSPRPGKIKTISRNQFFSKIHPVKLCPEISQFQCRIKSM